MTKKKRTITCTNNDGYSMTFGEKALAPYLLGGADGVYDSENTVNLTENTMIDGAVYQGSVTKYRNIVLTLKDIDDYEINRDMINRLFKKNSLGTLTFTEGEEVRAIEYYVEYVRSTGEEAPRITTISLICPDPFFYDPADINVYLAQWIDDFEFIHEFTADGEEFAHIMFTYENIYNENADEKTGITIVISGSADIVNPVVRRLEDNAVIQVGTTANPFTLSAGDTLTITTGDGNKHVWLTSNGTTTEVNQYLAPGWNFIQLNRGDNHIGYNADSGKTGMELTITYRMRYARA